MSPFEMTRGVLTIIFSLVATLGILFAMVAWLFERQDRLAALGEKIDALTDAVDDLLDDEEDEAAS